jgi:integrase
MAVRKLRNTWYVDIRFDDKRHRIRSPENTRSGAQAFEAVLRHKLARGVAIGKAPEIEQNPLFEQFAWQWFQQYVIPNNKYSEQYAKQKILITQLIPFFGTMPLREINSGHVERFKAQQVVEGVSNKTINNRLAVLGKCLRCAYEWHRIEMPSIKKLRCAPPKTDYLTVAECDLLLSSADGQMREMLFLALRTGMRQGEIRGLQWSSIDWHSRSIAVRHSRCDRNRSLVSPKSNRERHIPLDADLYEMLFRHKHESGYVFTNPTRNNEPYTSHHLIERLEPICAKARIRKITWHSLRHTFATQLIMHGVPLTVVKELLGHSTITTTMRYSHVAPAALRSAIELLNPSNVQVTDHGQQVGNRWQPSLAA